MSSAATQGAAQIRLCKLKLVAEELGETLLHSPENDPLARLHRDTWQLLRRAAIECKTVGNNART